MIESKSKQKGTCRTAASLRTGQTETGAVNYKVRITWVSTTNHVSVNSDASVKTLLRHKNVP